jgi:hypothetical protein
MELTINDDKMKTLSREVIIELFQEKKDVFYEILVEAIVEVGLGNAIEEGREDDFVEEETILSLLER